MGFHQTQSKGCRSSLVKVLVGDPRFRSHRKVVRPTITNKKYTLRECMKVLGKIAMGTICLLGWAKLHGGLSKCLGVVLRGIANEVAKLGVMYVVWLIVIYIGGSMRRGGG